MAAPIASQVLGEVLPYLEIKKDNEEQEEPQEVEVPNIIGLSEKEAKEVLDDVGLTLEVEENTKEDGANQEETSTATIIEQLPKAGIKIKQGTSVIAYTN